jgi:D-glycero-D-manno-heptose 1,7-bisphosphate phosphatase
MTNQAGIAKGLYTEDDFLKLMDWVVGEFRKERVTIDKVYHCPHHPDFTGPCSCRKPEPGMILKAVDAFSLDINECVLIGDKETDLEAGRRAGIPEKNMLLLECHPADFSGMLPGSF